ncbi:hypothetical protein ABB37_07793 [Leptomonas pyrrhocoris]|uniref:Tyrosine specific protein phosphatases domain-containing protein n=1 Tax=Leptomonas pyrrhocoris TaxID=157538 RepID=A0A0M9FUU9_LEPPY|nr:hypothetical protein ABB37_07793 [Leptomonas pyrrhocoris]XP_015654923.1 hypothetical protein ABB37_07793 [Leptomonas pyrrhocoris]KPA76483.1 hypothetical protein ABB37_07793 [Leptomonas pyrrhocoris]KPA76484.1 hypothetical protein ABB37_07793 [Leptomonas pyrrhocoris]|eukprot:XP_015654922.1 hypothetical protein ABB37_07793 [Leptomonas pyrrhocoris]
MFRVDAADDTTPAVAAFIRAISIPLLTTSPVAAGNNTSSSTGSLSHQHESGRDVDLCPSAESTRVGGHVLLSSLPRVTALARRRALLMRSTTSAVGSHAHAGVVFVRLVLSLLSSVAMERIVSPSTSSDERDADSVAHAVPVSNAISSSTESAALSPAVSSDASEIGAAAILLLPWCSAEADAAEEGTADVTYAASCVDEKNGNPAQGKHSAEDANHLLSPDGRLSGSPSTSSENGGFRCHVVLRSYPVAVFSTGVVRSLSQYWHEGPSLARQADADHDGAKESASSAFDSTAACLPAALEVFRARVRRHEVRSLRSVAHTCAKLLRELDAFTRSEKAKEECEVGSRSRPHEVLQRGTEYVIPVPIYGVALPVEDNQATRLERVGHLTTPLLQEVTGKQSLMQPLTAVLHQLHEWATTEPPAPPPFAALATPPAAPSRLSVAATLDPTSPALRLLLLTRTRLLCLQQYVHRALQSGAAPLSLSESSTSPIVELEVEKTCPVDLLRPACLVHCQLGVSRSPSVVFLFYMDVFRSCCRRAALRRSREQHTGGGVGIRERGSSEARDPSNCIGASADGAFEVDPDVAVELFHSFLHALVQARPRVKPNVCFAVQLLSQWNKRIC